MDEYYDLNSNRIFVRGIKDFKTIKDTDTDVIFKKLIYPFVLEIYLINQYGIVINTVGDNTISPVLVNGFPTVHLSTRIERNGKSPIVSNERYRIIDLVACNFIRQSECYLERGYIAINKNGILMDTHYSNIVYVPNQKDEYGVD